MIVPAGGPSVMAKPNDQPRIVVFGVGGAGLHAVDRMRMIEAGSRKVELVAVDTDAEALARCLAPRHLKIRLESRHGLGAGGRPEVGERAAEVAAAPLREACVGADLV